MTQLLERRDKLTITQVLRFNYGAVIKQVNVDGTESTIDLTELGVLDVTPGTAAASKALVLGANKEIATITSATITTLTTGAIAAVDASLDVTGLAAAQGGAVALTGGTSSTTGNAGGAVSLLGGTPGATGVGGAVNITGAAGGATSGSGGTVSITGGAGTAGNSNGGGIVLTPGAKQGSGLDGNLILRTGAIWFKQSAASADGADTPFTMTAAQMLGGICSMTPTTGRAVTTLTGAQIEAAVAITNLATDDAFEFSIQNRAAFAATDDIITLTAGASGVTVTGSAVINPGSTGRFRCRRTAVETYIIHKIAG